MRYKMEIVRDIKYLEEKIENTTSNVEIMFLFSELNQLYIELGKVVMQDYGDDNEDE